MKFLFVILVSLFSISAPAQVVDSATISEIATEVNQELDDENDFVGTIDTLKVDKRNFGAEEIERLQSDSDLNYKQPPTVVETLWDRFKQWLGWLFASLFEAASTTDAGMLLIYVIAAVIIIVVIMMLLKVNAFKVFYSGADQAKQNYSVFHENIHEMDFDKLIQEAVEKKQLRHATRLVFLYALKILSDKHLIDFNPGKTNHDYVEELSSPELKTGLNELSFYFDYAWYGNFSITESQFNKIRKVFNEWRSKVTG